MDTPHECQRHNCGIFSVTAYDGKTNSGTPIQVYIDVAAVNDPPIVANASATQSANYGDVFTYTFPANTFTDIDSESLSYSLEFLEDYIFPSWISFDGTNRTLTGTPTNTGTYGAMLKAFDGSASVQMQLQITVGKATVTVTPMDTARGYGETNPLLTGLLAGVVNGDNITATYTTTARAASPAGTYPITATLNDPDSRLTNYNVTLNQGTLAVTNSNALPTVTLTSPTTNHRLNAGFTVELTADASDSDGTISKVEFFVDAVKIGEDATAPYAFTWTNTAAGTFSLTAKATDNSNGTITSTAVIVTAHPYIHSAQIASSQFQMRFYGVKNFPYNLAYSSDLGTWTTFTNVTAVSGGVVVTHPFGGATNRFYRAVEIGPQ